MVFLSLWYNKIHKDLKCCEVLNVAYRKHPTLTAIVRYSLFTTFARKNVTSGRVVIRRQAHLKIV